MLVHVFFFFSFYKISLLDFYPLQSFLDGSPLRSLSFILCYTTVDKGFTSRFDLIMVESLSSRLGPSHPNSSSMDSFQPSPRGLLLPHRTVLQTVSLPYLQRSLLTLMCEHRCNQEFPFLTRTIRDLEVMGHGTYTIRV